MTAPLVLMTADIRELQGYRWHAAISHYVDAVANVSAVNPVLVPALSKGLDIEGLLDRADGVVATGSRTNVHPDLYGGLAGADTEPHDHERDAMALALIKAAIDRGVPLLCICRGMQELNVALGGTLDVEIQEMEGRMDHRSPDVSDNDERFAIRQKVRIEPGSELGRILNSDTIDVNSLHRQAIGRLAPGLVVEGTAPDGTIEAVRVEKARAFALGVQWHPEYWAETDHPSARIFQAFGDAVRYYADQRDGSRVIAAQ